MIVTNRDRNLLQALSTCSILTTRQVQRQFFKNAAATTVLRRLRMLLASGLIRKASGLPIGQVAWTLAADGAALIGQKPKATGINRNTLAHDVTLNDVRFALEKAGLAKEWQGQAQLKRSITPRSFRGKSAPPLVPDAIFAAEVNGKLGAVALELELSRKNNVRYRTIFRQYGNFSKLSAIWYVVSSRGLGEALLRLWEKEKAYGYRPKFGWLLLSEVLSDPTKAMLQGSGEVRLLKGPIEGTEASFGPLKPLLTA